MDKNATIELVAAFEEKKHGVKIRVDILQAKILRRALAAVVVVGLLLSSVILTTLYLDHYQLQADAITRQTSSIVFTIDVWIEKVRTVAEQISARTTVINNLSEYLDGQKAFEAYQKEAQDKLQDLLVSGLVGEKILSVLQFNSQGELLVSIGLTISPSLLQSFIQKKELQISEPIFLENQKMIAVKADIYDRFLKKVGFNIFIISLNSIEERLNQMQNELNNSHLMISLIYWPEMNSDSQLQWQSLYHTDLSSSNVFDYEKMLSEITRLYPHRLPSKFSIGMKNNQYKKYLVRTKNILNTSWLIIFVSAEINFYYLIIKDLLLTFFYLLILIVLAALWLKKYISPLSAAVVQSAFEQSEKIREQSFFVARQNQSLQEAVEKLKSTQNQLIESETFASVGRMVAGVSHEINTPLGVAIAAVSHLNYEVDLFGVEFNQGPIRRSSLEKLLALSKEYGYIITGNLNQAINLVRSLKQISVDQIDIDFREIYFKEYLQTILTGLTPMMKDKEISIYLVGDETLKLETFPGIITQMVTNLVENSIKHGFKNQERGEISIQFFFQENDFYLIYSDSGAGVEISLLPKIFDAFFTTGRVHGCSGLGLHIVKSIVMQKLNGKIKVKVPEGQGLAFEIVWPIKLS